MATVVLVTTDFGIEVRCSECQAVLDRVPEDRMAYCRAGTYLGHECIAKQNDPAACDANRRPDS